VLCTTYGFISYCIVLYCIVLYLRIGGVLLAGCSSLCLIDSVKAQMIDIDKQLFRIVIFIWSNTAVYNRVYIWSETITQALFGQATFPQLYQELQLHDSALWSTYSRSSQCEQEFPPFVSKKLSAFQQLLVVQATRPDRLQSAMTQFACNALGTLSCSICQVPCTIQLTVTWTSCKYLMPKINFLNTTW